jgi:hypothetical protein
MITREQAQQLLDDYNLCCKAKPKHNAIDIQLEKDNVSKWAVNLNNQIGWGSEHEITEAYYQLEPRLRKLQDKLVFEVLKHGI